MTSSLLKALLLLFILSLTVAAPTEDEVHFPIQGYNEHKWYSGTSPPMQDISTSPLVPSTTSSSILNVTLTTTLLCYGSTVGQDVPVSSVPLDLSRHAPRERPLRLHQKHHPLPTERFRLEQKGQRPLSRISWRRTLSPIQVGFSKSFRNNNFTYTDGTTTEDNYRALIDFFRKFPNLKKNDFYISGESYAGIYVPYLANEILEKNKLPSSETKINLKGILVGNACTDPRECY
jgi:hypothetical protein